MGYPQLANTSLNANKKPVWGCTKTTETRIRKCAIGNGARHLGGNFAKIL